MCVFGWLWFWLCNYNLIYLFICFMAPIGSRALTLPFKNLNMRFVAGKIQARAGKKGAASVIFLVHLFVSFYDDSRLNFFKQAPLIRAFSNNLRFFRFVAIEYFFSFFGGGRERGDQMLSYFIVWFLCVTSAPLFHVLWLSILYDSLYCLCWKRMQKWIFITPLLFWVHFICGKMFQIFCFLA